MSIGIADRWKDSNRSGTEDCLIEEVGEGGWASILETQGTVENMGITLANQSIRSSSNMSLKYLKISTRSYIKLTHINLDVSRVLRP